MLVLTLVPLIAVAAAAPEPVSASSSTLPYSSAFADYKPWREVQPGNWRALNAAASGDGMGAMTGMHEMDSSKSVPGMPPGSASAAPAIAQAASGAASAPPHTGHHLHGGRQ